MKQNRKSRLNTEMRNLFWKISKCQHVCSHFSKQISPCKKIIKTQNVTAQRDFLLPEPWNGDIDARLLFIASNPSIDENECYPKCTWRPDLIEDFFIHRFSGGTRDWVSDRQRVLLNSGNYGEKSVRYWCEIAKQAERAYGHKAGPGKDYAITEVVHCKSKNRKGVPQSLNICPTLFLKELVKLSDARVVIWVGAEALFAARKCFGMANDIFHRPSERTCNKYFIFIPAPNSRMKRKLHNLLTEAQLVAVQNELNRE